MWSRMKCRRRIMCIEAGMRGEERSKQAESLARASMVIRLHALIRQAYIWLQCLGTYRDIASSKLYMHAHTSISYTEQLLGSDTSRRSCPEATERKRKASSENCGPTIYLTIEYFFFSGILASVFPIHAARCRAARERNVPGLR